MEPPTETWKQLAQGADALLAAPARMNALGSSEGFEDDEH